MTTGRALLVLDVVNDVVNVEGQFGASMGYAAAAADRNLAERLSAAVTAARGRGDLVAWAYPGSEFLAGVGLPAMTGWGAEVDEAYGRIADDEVMYEKRALGALAGTTLKAALDAAGVDTVLLSGVSTSAVVTATAAEVLDAGYTVVVLEDCCSDASGDAHSAALAALPSSVRRTDSRSLDA